MRATDFIKEGDFDDLDDDLKQELRDFLQSKRNEKRYTDRGMKPSGPGIGLAITGGLFGLTSAGPAGMFPGAILGFIVELGLWMRVAMEPLNNASKELADLQSQIEREVKGNAASFLPQAINKLYPMYSKFVMNQLVKHKLISKNNTGDYIYLGKDINADVDLVIDNTFRNEIRKQLDNKEFYEQLRDLGFPMHQLYFENEEVFNQPLFQMVTDKLREKVVNDININQFADRSKTNAVKPRIKLKLKDDNTVPSFSVDPADRPKR
jgi:hypothetical protein